METARDLTLRLQDLLRREHGALADFLLELAAFDQRRAWAELGYASVFVFLHRDLGLSKGAVHSTGLRNTESDTGDAHEPDSLQFPTDERYGSR
jgi:hypothetical protein